MKNKIWILSLVTSLLYLIGKILVAIFGNEYGFLLATVAAGLTTYKFWKIDNTKTLAVLEGLTIFVLLYSFHKWQEKSIEPTENEQIIGVIGTGLIIIFIIYQYVRIEHISIDFILETTSVIGFTVGGLLIIYQNSYGWIGYTLAHSGVAILQYRKRDYVFCFFQGISAIITLYATKILT